jgi:hypothetical protein
MSLASASRYEVRNGVEVRGEEHRSGVAAVHGDAGPQDQKDDDRDRAGEGPEEGGRVLERGDQDALAGPLRPVHDRERFADLKRLVVPPGGARRAGLSLPGPRPDLKQEGGVRELFDDLGRGVLATRVQSVAAPPHHHGPGHGAHDHRCEEPEQRPERDELRPPFHGGAIGVASAALEDAGERPLPQDSTRRTSRW